MQDEPNAVQIELTEGCNLYCDFCGLQGIRESAGGPYKFMENETLHHLCQAIRNSGWNPRVEFAMHGEPTMHPHFAAMIGVVREYLPNVSIMLTTNGGGLVKDPIPRVHDLLAAGLNVLAIDAYEYVNIATRLRKAFDGAGVPYWEYPAHPEANPHRRRHPRSDMDIVFVQDISVATEGTHSSLNSHCGSAYECDEIEARCAKPFRELSVRWDGNVAICCNDWKGELMIANVLDYKAIDELWNHQRFEAARRFLYAGNRSITPCNRCDAKSTRVGLLPDRKGLLDLPPPTDKDREVLS